MKLKKLELSGFKSFARTTVLEFPSRITAIVGPNGSGKSNIAESIRWVLGEQSMKSLRGKKGEDLIWSGSSLPGGGVPRMGKASAALFFDNSNGAVPIEFEEVALGRKIYRDGSNEYAINGSPVRLKDVVELIARMGLGETKHNIIGQGEVDRLLLSSARERREMLEEALGLRVYHLKKIETERKLAAAEQNMGETQALIRELTPHLKFLRQQAKRAEARAQIAAELKECEGVWVVREGQEIEREARDLAGRAEPLAARHALEREEIGRLEKEIAEAEGQFRTKRDTLAEHGDPARVTRHHALEREIGRLEGKLEAEREKAAAAIPAPAADFRAASEDIRATLAEVRDLLEEGGEVRMVRAHLLALIEDIEKALDAAEHGRPIARPVREGFSNGARRGIIGEGEPGAVREIERAIRALQEELELAGREIAAADRKQREELDATGTAHENLRRLDTALRVVQDQERDTALARERLKFDETRIRERREAYQREAKVFHSEPTPPDPEVLTPDFAAYADMSQAELCRKIERLGVRLEEVGGIDETIVKEYAETEARHAFLTKELEDLRQAAASLKALIKELENRMKSDFREGFAKVKDEFHNYFRIIFGGGAGRLRIAKQESRIAGEGMPAEEEEAQEGIEIEVDLPRKRIHGLAMLSGGERALTAIALLFAITAVNPPPFLILDETDAALDEANTQRYAAILKELAKKTQLLLVTHNRETMKSAGILYGVTMGDDGVSRLLSLKLEEAGEYTNR